MKGGRKEGGREVGRKIGRKEERKVGRQGKEGAGIVREGRRRKWPWKKSQVFVRLYARPGISQPKSATKRL